MAELLVRFAISCACLGLFAACDASPANAARFGSSPRDVPAQTPPARPAASSRAPWGVRFVRPCSSWAGTQMLVTDHRVLTCSNALFDLDGKLVRMADADYPLAGFGDRSLWSPSGTMEELRARGEADLDAGALVIRDEDLQRVGVISAPEISALHGDGPHVLGSGDDAVYDLDLRAMTAAARPASARCAAAMAVGPSADGSPQCVVSCGAEGACLRATSSDLDVNLGRVTSAAWVARAERWVVTDSARTRWLDARGRTLASRSADEPMIRAVSRTGEVLVSTRDATELEQIAGTRLDVERVLDMPASDGAFFGHRIVVVLPSSEAAWLERGAPPVRRMDAPPTPAGYSRLFEAVEPRDTDHPSATQVYRDGSGSTWSRSLVHTAAFTGRGGEVFVSRIDSTELARFAGDDAAWASAATARYLEQGERRWARAWRDQNGHRVVRGHTYLGGCERTDIDLLIREDGHGVEMWQAFAVNRRALDALLGPIPKGARSVAGADRDRYRGDPSIGRQP